MYVFLKLSIVCVQFQRNTTLNLRPIMSYSYEASISSKKISAKYMVGLNNYRIANLIEIGKFMRQYLINVFHLLFLIHEKWVGQYKESLSFNQDLEVEI